MMIFNLLLNQPPPSVGNAAKEDWCQSSQCSAHPSHHITAMPWYCNLQRMRTIFKIMTELCVLEMISIQRSLKGSSCLSAFIPACFSHTFTFSFASLTLENCFKIAQNFRDDEDDLSTNLVLLSFKQELLCLQPVFNVSCGNIASCLKTRKMKKQNARYPDVHLSTVCSHLRSVKVAFMRKTWPNRRLELDRWALNCAKKRIQGFRFTPRKANTRMDTTPGGKGLGKI